MLVLGYTGKELPPVRVHHPCSQCGHSAQLLCETQRYIHFFFLPLVPLKKKMTLQCEECGNQGEPSPTERRKHRHRIPPYWIGALAILIAFLIGYVIWQSYHKPEATGLKTVVVHTHDPQTQLPVYRVARYRVNEEGEIMISWSQGLYPSPAKAKQAIKEPPSFTDPAEISPASFEKLKIVSK